MLRFIRESPAPVGKREIARALGIGANDRRTLNQLLRDLEEENAIGRVQGRRYSAGALPSTTVIEVTGIDADGEALARPLSWRGEGPPPQIYLMADRRGRAPGPGDRILARLRPLEGGEYEARILRRLPSRPDTILGVFRVDGEGGRVQSTDRRIRTEFIVPMGETSDAVDGEFVRCQVRPGKVLGLPTACVTERFGRFDAPGAASLIAIQAHDIPVEFPPAAVAEADAAGAAPISGRVDLRDVPLLTIDDEDARDFDDAVWAEPDGDPDNAGGWHLLVAIADVAWYVRPDSALDGCAGERGNSVYFPDRVVPMLPEALSNGVCSLKPGEDRPCLAVHMWIDASGNKHRHEFVRGMMRSAARLTYSGIQHARDGRADEEMAPPVAAAVAPLYGAFEALHTARRARGTIDLDLAERRIVMDEAGMVRGIEKRPRHDSHRLIEEFMILANVCAAESLEHARHPCLYRIHDEPPPDRLVALRRYLETLGFRLGGGQAVRPRNFAQILTRVAGTPHAHAVNQAILRSQAQAVYSPENLGHFGLALRRYSHFTSPIRRFADLLVHRALITANGLGEGGLAPRAAAEFAAIGEHVSMTERRAAAAERQAGDRLVTGFLADRVGAEFDGRITGIERFGMFVALDETGAEGLLPLSALGEDSFRFDAQRQVLVGRHSEETFALGDAIRVTLAEADPVAGRLLFRISGRTPRPQHAGGRRRTGGPPKRRGGRRKR